MEDLTMANKTPPTTLTAGDHYTWTEDSTVAGERWEYIFSGDRSHKVTVTGEYAANVHTFTITPAISARFGAGIFTITKLVYADGERTTTRKTATLQVYPDPAATHEPSHNEKMVAALKESLEGGAPDFLESHSVNGISVNRLPHLEKLAMLRRYEARLAREIDRARVADGKPSRREILIKF